MKKKLISMTVLSAALALSAGTTAFAAGWEQRNFSGETKWTYVDDKGNPVKYAGWFTDPADGAIYYMDPDGAMMADTEVEGFKLGPDGRRIEKTAEDLAEEAERAAKAAARKTPGKEQAAANVAAKAAKTAEAAVSTFRTPYQAEMKVLINTVLTETKSRRTGSSVKDGKQEDNVESIYYFVNPDGYRFLTASLWKISKPTAANYKEQAFELAYHFDSAMADVELYDSAYGDLVIAALGESEGKAVVDFVQGEREKGVTELKRAGKTDAGNSYSLTYSNNYLTLSVVCSETEPEAASETTEAQQ